MSAGRRQRTRIAVAEIDGWTVTETLCRAWIDLGAFQVGLGPRREMQMAAFLGELPGARQANSLGRTGDEGELAAQIEIHVNLPGP